MSRLGLMGWHNRRPIWLASTYVIIWECQIRCLGLRDRRDQPKTKTKKLRTENSIHQSQGSFVREIASCPRTRCTQSGNSRKDPSTEQSLSPAKIREVGPETTSAQVTPNSDSTLPVEKRYMLIDEDTYLQMSFTSCQPRVLVCQHFLMVHMRPGLVAVEIHMHVVCKSFRFLRKDIRVCSFKVCIYKYVGG